MMSLVAHNLRIATRQATWPLALGLHLAGAVLFVAVWGPSNGVPLWTAPVLAQFVAADRVFLAVLLTWLSTPLCAPGAHADLIGWSAVSGASVARILVSRATAAGILALLMITSAMPVATVASHISPASAMVLVGAVLEMSSFALLIVGLTAAASLVSRNPLVVWIASMAITGIAAFGIRLLVPGAARIAVCAIVGAAGVAAAAATVTQRWSNSLEPAIDEATP